jgi:hypothetical protein
MSSVQHRLTCIQLTFKNERSTSIPIVKVVYGLVAGMLVTTACLNTLAQEATSPASPQKPLMLITWFGTGGIPLPISSDWKPELLTVYDNIQRPVAQFSNPVSHVNVSYILFENHSGKPTSEGCQEDAIMPILQHQASLISKRKDDHFTGPSGQIFATTSFLVDQGIAQVPHQRNLFGFLGNASTCAEVHVSSFGDDPGVVQAMQTTLAEFHPDLDYRPSAEDYFLFASILFKGAPGQSAPYYKEFLNRLPPGAQTLTMRRVATDQLVMALGMSGDLKNSRAVAELAVKDDPDYPINYYNLACADAEAGDAASAQEQLQKAFDRQANVIKGESMPDPTKDDSILKLKKNKTFWAFVQSLPRN